MGSRQVRCYRAAFGSLFGWAYWSGRVPADPAARLGARVRTPSRPAAHAHWLDDRQIRALVATTQGLTSRDVRDRVVLLAGLLAGLRTGEIAALCWRDADLLHARVRVIRKGGRPTAIALAPELADALARWRDLLTTEHAIAPALPVVLPIGSGERIDIDHHSHITSEALRRIVRTRGTQAGIDRLRPHDLRRTLAGLLHRRGAPIEDIKDVLGHSTLAVTQRYLAPDPFRAHRRLEELRLPA